MGDHVDHEAKAARRLRCISRFLHLIIAVFGAFAGSVSTGLAVASTEQPRPVLGDR